MEQSINTIFKNLGVWALIMCTANAVCSLLNLSWYEPFDIDLLIIGVAVGLFISEGMRVYFQKDSV